MFIHTLPSSSNQRNTAAKTPTTPSPKPAPVTDFAIAPPVDTPTVALPAAAVLVLDPPAPKENDPDAAALLVINVVGTELLLPAAGVSEAAAAVEVVFHM